MNARPNLFLASGRCLNDGHPNNSADVKILQILLPKKAPHINVGLQTKGAFRPYFESQMPYFLYFKTSERPFLNILLLTVFPFLSAFCSSKDKLCTSLQESEQQSSIALAQVGH